jgi:RNA polymerase sigma factor (sigma-70 family)
METKILNIFMEDKTRKVFMAAETQQSLGWPEIHKRLKRDQNDQLALTSLKNKIRRWARRDFWEHGDVWIDDVVEDTCFSVIEHILDTHKAFSGHVLGLYFNVRRIYRRDVQRGLRALPIEEVNASNPASDSEADIWVNYLEECLDGLPTRERLAVDMRFLKEHSYDEVAEKLKVKYENARRIVFNAKQLLRKCIEKKMARA